MAATLSIVARGVERGHWPPVAQFEPRIDTNGHEWPLLRRQSSVAHPLKSYSCVFVSIRGSSQFEPLPLGLSVVEANENDR